MSHSECDLSVLLVNWNGLAVLPRCLGSLKAATAGLRAETILVDNGSRDGSVEHVRRFAPEVQVIEVGQNRGFAAGNNLGMRRARGRYLLLLNTDTELPPGALPALLAHMQRNPEVGFLGCSHRDRAGQPQVSYERSFSGPLARAFRGMAEPGEDGLLDVAWISGACMMARRELYQQIGGMDEDYPLYYEDVDWCYRAHLRGWRVCWTPGVSIIHDVGGSSASLSQARKRKLQVLSESVFYRKHAGLLSSLWWLGANLTGCCWHLALGVVRFVSWPRRRTWHRLRYRANELAAFLGAALGQFLPRQRST
jgi:hypothetical protein